MHTLRIELGKRGYPIRIGSGLLARSLSFGEAAGRSCRIVTDSNVAAHYLSTVRATLRVEERHCRVLNPGEEQKTFVRAGALVDWLLESGLARDGVVVALGGGVVGDLAGFAAAVCQRGVDFVQVPTTLLAQVDSSVGGKTGVNHARGKNLIGAFHQPRAVVADLDTLKTLPRRELLAGVAEVIKYALLGDSVFFQWLEQQLPSLLALDPVTLAETVEHCCQMKASIVAADEQETGMRALLNLGHTFGHAIEAHAGYGTWLHGEAVATGLCMAADLSARLGWMDQDEAQRACALVERAGLPTRPPAGLSPDRFLALMGHDKKVRNGRLRLVLLRSIGEAGVTDEFEPRALDATLAHFCTDGGAAA